MLGLPDTHQLAAPNPSTPTVTIASHSLDKPILQVPSMAYLKPLFLCDERVPPLARADEARLPKPRRCAAYAAQDNILFHFLRTDKR